MLFAGIICLVLGFLLGIHLLWVLGIVLAAIGVMLLIATETGHAIGGRSRWY